jgi:myo-inositol-1(or 4)-monophosphatase
MKYDLNNIKEAAVRMALHCGRIQMESFRTHNIGIDTKSNVYDVVTKVDKACEGYLLSEISRLYPAHSVIGEETGQHLHADSDWAWIVDPLDGTNSYSQGLPVFCVSIGVTYKNSCVVGVVYAPYLDELFTAVKGEGAWFGKAGDVGDANYESRIMNYELNRQRLHVSPKTALKECVVASGFPYDKATNPINNIREVSIIIPQVRGFRRMGSAAYDLCCTAMGTIDAYWEYNLNPWDVCAGQLIVQEAGGTVIPLCDNRKISIIAGPDRLVKELQGIFVRN